MVSRRMFFVAPAALAAAPRIARGAPDAFASPWSEATHSAVRLIAGAPEAAGGRLAAGLEFRLARNFKTYWRDPGDAGVPPVFDWAGSVNCAAIDVLWPTPTRFEDGAGWSIGYHPPLILPIRIRPDNASATTALRLKIDYAVCENLCVPAQGQASLVVPPTGGSPYAARIAESAAKAPRPTALGEAAPSGLSIASIELVDGPKPALAVFAIAPDKLEPDLFIEGPSGSFFGRPMVEAPGYPGKLKLVAPIEERARNLARWPLRLTLVAGADAIDVEAAIDAPAQR